MKRDTWLPVLCLALGVLVAYVFVALVMSPKDAPVVVAANQPAVAPPSVARYQIVNPTPDRIQNTMLLDTTTGKTWITCNVGASRTTAAAVGWCPVTWDGKN